MSKVLDLVRKDSDVLLDEWLKGIKTGIRRRDLIDERLRGGDDVRGSVRGAHGETDPRSLSAHDHRSPHGYPSSIS